MVSRDLSGRLTPRFANTGSVDRTILTLSTGGNDQDIKAMLELYGDIIADHEPQIDQETTRRGKNTTQTTTQTTQETTRTNAPKLQPVQDHIIQELKKNPNLSRKDLAKIITSVTEDGIKYHLKKLQEKGLLRLGTSGWLMQMDGLWRQRRVPL